MGDGEGFNKKRLQTHAYARLHKILELYNMPLADLLKLQADYTTFDTPRKAFLSEGYLKLVKFKGDADFVSRILKERLQVS
jgi:hypothetical protein